MFTKTNTSMLVSIRRTAKWFRGLLWAAVFSLGGIFAVSGVAQAALTTPTAIISGSQYAESGTPHESLGLDKIDPTNAWVQESQQNRKILALEPEAGQKVYFAAYVNDDPSACTGTLCRLEFKKSIDGGVTWSRAIDSGLQYLPLETTGGRYDYNLVAGPNGQDVWVAYVGNSALMGRIDGENRYGNMHIRKLAWNSSTKQWTMGNSATVDHVPFNWSARPDPDGDGYSGNWSNGVATTTFHVQLMGGNEIVWVVMIFDDEGTLPGLFYTNSFSTATPTWQLSSWNVTSTNSTQDAHWPHEGADSRIIIVPIGQTRVPAVIRVTAREYTRDTWPTCGWSNNPLWMNISTLADSSNVNSWNAPLSLHSVEPLSWRDSQAGIPCVPPEFASENPPADSGLAFSFSAAANIDSATTSRLLLAFHGGRENVKNYTQNLAQLNKLQVFTANLSINGQLTNKRYGTFNGSSYIGDATYIAPSVGFQAGVGYIAARELGTNDLAVFAETGLTPAYTWGQVLAGGASNPSSVAYSVSMPPETPSGWTVNSGLPPIAWEQAGAQRIAFSANSGGNVYGYGWSSNFGWLSMNCANSKSTDACSPPTSSPYGTNIAVAPVNTPITVNFSPTPTDMTYAASGYGWSSNAGFISFRRLDSVCDTSAGCTGGDDNDFGNPPGQAYRNSTSTNDPTLKYDKSTQKLNGWGRFVNLCNYQDIGGGTFRCLDAQGGWVRFQGYWRDSTKTSTLRRAYVAGNLQLPLVDASTFPNPAVTGKNEIGIIGEEYFYYSSIGTDIFGEPVLNLVTNDILRNYPIGTPVYAAGGDYGVSAYYSGNGYLLSGWAWSAEYGWIRFNPLIFLGYAWIETLFGNIYVNGGGADAGNFQLPDAQRLTGERLTSCGRDLDNDGDGDEACYVSTYRIEANGSLQPLAHPSGQSVSAGSSASVEFLESLLAGDSACGFDGDYSDCSRSLGTTAPELFGRDGASFPNTFGFPSVQTSTATYRNALGKLDVGGLTKDVTGLYVLDDILGTKDFQRSTNRFGQKLFITKKNGSSPVGWTVNELAGQFAYNPPGGAFTPDIPLDAIENQVVHIQGDLTIGHDPNEANIAASTLTAAVSGQRAAINGAGGTLTLASAANFPTPSATFPLSGTVILGTGSGKEEYLSYTGKSGNQLTGVRTITGKPTSLGSGDHGIGVTVRWVWRMPYTVGQTLPRNITFVVDGDLKIHYNIIASDPTKDLDLAAITPASIRDSMAAAFIVRGNVSIAKEVNRITGAFIVIGRDSSKDPDLNADTPSAACSAAEYEYDGCGGAFDTGNDADAAFCGGTDKKCNPLTIEGLLFARKFNFTRTGALDTIDVSAEQVTFDQRLFLNPPPGLEDVTKALPNPTRELP